MDSYNTAKSLLYDRYMETSLLFSNTAEEIGVLIDKEGDELKKDPIRELFRTALNSSNQFRNLAKQLRTTVHIEVVSSVK